MGLRWGRTRRSPSSISLRLRRMGAVSPGSPARLYGRSADGWPVQASSPPPKKPTPSVPIVARCGVPSSKGETMSLCATALGLPLEKRRENIPVGTPLPGTRGSVTWLCLFRRRRTTITMMASKHSTPHTAPTMIPIVAPDMPEPPPSSSPPEVPCGVVSGVGTPTTSEVNDVTLAPLHSEDVARTMFSSDRIPSEVLSRVAASLSDDDRISNWIDTDSNRLVAAATPTN
mmetsp:Transcript_24121/g.57545  ORF Transcript_24121/g.57545 Transcript_24121/m.57545 type:complete len:230 (-) Transcript_24121:1636-2325(-)